MRTWRKIITTLAVTAGITGIATAQGTSEIYASQADMKNSSSVLSYDPIDPNFDLHSKVGVKGGWNYASISNTAAFGSQVNKGFHAGLYAKMNVAGRFSIQPELLFSRQGGDLKYNNQQFFGRAEFQNDYINIPVLMRVDLGPVNLHAGPYASYLTRSEVTTEDSRGAVLTQNMDEETMNRYDYGLSGGIGIEYKIIDFGVRYNHGLADIMETNAPGREGLLNGGRNAVTQIYFGIGF